MKYLASILLLLFARVALAVVPPCPQTSGNGQLTLNVTTPRTSGISPFLVFFDATTTTDTNVNLSTSSTFQDVQYVWNFDDTLGSGAGTWPVGANAGHHSRNAAIGGVTAHLYVTDPLTIDGSGNTVNNGRDTRYSPSVTAKDSAGNSVTCGLGVTAFDPNKANGFPGVATTCVAASTLPVAGKNGCPTGAAVLQQASYSTVIGSSAFGNSKRVLFRCGDTFTTASGVSFTAVKWAIDSYGGCENTQTNRPIFSTTGGVAILFGSNTAAMGDGRIANIDFNGNGGSNFPILQQGGAGGKVAYQLTFYNLNARNSGGLMQTGAAAQQGTIASTMLGMKQIGVYFNNGGMDTTLWPGSVFPNLFYQALIGNSLNGVGVTNGCNGIETFRISAAQYFVASDNDIQNANNCGPVFKVHQANPGSAVTWGGQYSQYIEQYGNYFHGTSGAAIVENAPQATAFDERMRYVVFEGNLLVPNSATGDTFMVSAQFETVRNNVILIPAGQSAPNFFNFHVGTRGNWPAFPTSFVQIYNNICDVLSLTSGQSCINLNAGPDMTLDAVNTTIKNNMGFASSGLVLAVPGSGTGNVISNNTVTTSVNPAFTNGSGTLLTLTDYQPTANFSGGVPVPNFSDALGTQWPPTWDLGAVHH